MAYIGNSPANVGNYQVVDDISASFNGTLTSFALTANSLVINPAKSGQLLVSINGVLQEPDDTGTDGFKVSGSNIVFSSAPATSSTFWAVWQGNAVDIGTPSDGTVGPTQLSATGTAGATNFLSGDNTWKVVDTNLVSDTTPQLGGDLDLNGHVITGLATDLVDDLTPQLGGDLDFNGKKATTFTSTGIDDNATSTAITTTDSETTMKQLHLYEAGEANPLEVRSSAGYTTSGGAILYRNGGSEELASIKGSFDTAGNGNYGRLSFGTRTTDVLGVEEKMRIDSAGRVTMPYQPAFYAYGSSTYVVRAQPVNYDNATSGVAFNTGGHYSTSTYKFTAPVAGSYMFSVGAITDSPSGAGGPHLVRNGTSFAKSYSLANQRCRNAAGVTYLNVGDWVAVYIDGENIYYLGGGYGHFSGHLIG